VRAEIIPASRLGNGRHLLQKKLARGAFNHGEIGKPYTDPGLEQTRQEGDRAGKPIDLGHDQRHLTHARGG
jgi:hypothetical protein